MPLTKKEKRTLGALCCRAADVDLAIGQWLFGPSSGTYYVLELRTRDIVAGASGMTLVELEAWFSQLDSLSPEQILNIGSQIAA